MSFGDSQAPVLVLHGRSSADAAPVRVEFPLSVPNRRVVVQQIVQAAGRLSEANGDEHFLRLVCAAIVLCSEGLERALREEERVTFAGCGYSLLQCGGEAYEFLSAKRFIRDVELFAQGQVAIRACFTARNDWVALQEATAAARKVSAAETPPPPGTAERTP